MGSFLSNICYSVYSTTGLHSVFSSILYTSIILSIIVLLILMFIYPCKKGTPSWILIKIFLYVLSINTIVFAIHNSIIKNNYKEKYLNNNVDTLMQNVYGGNKSPIYETEKLPVEANFRENTYENKEENDTSVEDLLRELG